MKAAELIRAGGAEDGAAPTRDGELGRRLRQLRTSRGLSLAGVAEATGISPSFLSMVENGQSDITVSRLMRHVHSFGVSVTDLLPEHAVAPARVVRADERQTLEMSDERIRILMLSADGHNAMLPVLNVYAEGGAMAEPARHDGEEFVHVLHGSVELVIGDAEPILLGAGDSAYYRADSPHSFRNAGSGEAVFFGVTTPPNL
jgi:transcriptional regulator with XRE-family HTH domain